jgi:predicted dehydrogenase
MKKKTGISRRHFVGAAGTAGLFGLSGCMGFPAITSVRSPNGLLRHASIGCGGKALGDLRAISTHKKVEMAAFCDVDRSRLDACRNDFPNGRFYVDWRELLDAEGDRIDSVCIGVPDHHHLPMAVEAMRRGKHVFLEKPMAKTMVEAKMLRDVAADAGVVTQMGTQYCAFASDRQTVQMMREQTLGPVEKVYLFSTRKGISRRRRLVPTVAQVPKTLDWDLWLGPAAYRPYAPKVYHPLIWRIWRDLGSGWIGDIGCHLIAAAWLGMDLGSRAPKDVWAETITDAEDGVKDLVWPTAAHIKWSFDGVAASGGKPFEFEWFDGCSEPDALAPASFRPPAEVEELFRRSFYKKRPHEGKAVKCANGWILQPHGVKNAYAVKNDGTEVKAPELPEVATHYHEFVDCALEGRNATADFSWSSYMRECVIAGEIAERCVGRTLKWDPQTRRFDCDAANAFLTREYRKGWEVPGLA